jgi:hypothetical protein
VLHYGDLAVTAADVDARSLRVEEYVISITAGRKPFAFLAGDRIEQQ